MKQLFMNLVSFIKSLTFVDVVFFSAIVLLIILVVTMIYIFRMNDEGEVEEMIELPKKPEDEESGELLDLATLSKAIEMGSKATIDLTAYEEEQEEKAIISYDELIKNHNTVKINYKEESQVGDVIVKEVDLDNLTSNVDRVDEDIRVTAINYAKEEAFLETLKKMRQLLS